jgi:hypothetical protein
MNRISELLAGAFVASLLLGAANHVLAQFAVGVMSYDAGSTPTAGFTTASAALGSPERLTVEGSFPTVVSPFSPPFLSSEIVSVGEGGHITLRLSHYAVPQAGGPEIGVFENVGLIDASFPNGVAGSPAMAFGIDSAVVDVSPDGVNWTSLGRVTFDVPANAYTDLADPFSSTAGSVPSDFQQPFTGELASFSGRRYSDAADTDMLDLFAGSGGGKWLDISATGLAQVGFIRFSVADDMDAMSRLNFELDAVSIAHSAVGARIIPEPSCAVLSTVAAAVMFRGGRQCRRKN